MAGGIFVDQPFHANPKCIVLGIILMMLYWFLACNPNEYMLPMIFIIGYISLAWYDYVYDCRVGMLYSGSNLLGLATADSWAKPQRRSTEEENNIHHNNHKGEKVEKKNLSMDQEFAYKRKIFALHLLILGPIFILAGLTVNKGYTNVKIRQVVGVLGLLVLFYHSVRFFYPRQTATCGYKENPRSRSMKVQKMRIVNLFHILFIAPFLLYVGLKKYPNRTMIKLLVPLGLLVMSYHGYKLYTLKPQCTKK